MSTLTDFLTGTHRRPAYSRRRLASSVAIRVVVALLLALGTAIVLADTRAHAAPTDRGVHVIGDSITYRAHAYDWSPLNKANRPPRWTVDAFPGRRMTAVRTRYVQPTDDYWTAVKHIFRVKPRRHRVHTVVVALGTNGADHEMTVRQAARFYARGVRILRHRPIWRRGPKRIVLVTPWRDPEIKEGATRENSEGETVEYPPYQWADKSVVYRKAMYHVARHSSRVCVVPWHRYAAAHPNRFKDGVHPDRIGVEAWDRQIRRGVRDC